MLPCIRAAAKDPELTATSHRVLLFLSEVLDVEQETEVKQSWLAKELEISERGARNSLTQLCKRGYMDQGKRKRGGPLTYKLRYRRRLEQ